MAGRRTNTARAVAVPKDFASALDAQELGYEDRHGVMHAVKSDDELDARLLQDIIKADLADDPVETETWLLRYLNLRDDPALRERTAASIARIRAYLDPKCNHPRVDWRCEVIPQKMARRVMFYLEDEGVIIGRPRGTYTEGGADAR